MSKWIKCTERLPNNMDTVLAVIEEIPFIPHVVMAEMIDNTWILSECLVCGNAATLNYKQEVTYWQPLPAPPIE